MALSTPPGALGWLASTTGARLMASAKTLS